VVCQYERIRTKARQLQLFARATFRLVLPSNFSIISLRGNADVGIGTGSKLLNDIVLSCELVEDAALDLRAIDDD